jgi:hypothetical protein
VVIELGAGTTVPTIRCLSEQLIQRDGARLIRINPSEAQASVRQISLKMGALMGLQQIEAAL